MNEVPAGLLRGYRPFDPVNDDDNKIYARILKSVK